MQSRFRSSQRAFLSPTFARACEQAHGRAHVAVLHDGGTIRGFFPFQFRSAWHQAIGVAERIGGGLCDAAGLIAEPALRIDATSLMRLCRLGALFITHLTEDQASFGLDATWTDFGYMTEIEPAMGAACNVLLPADRNFVRDTERRMRRAENRFGPLAMARLEQISPEMISALIEQKRSQYRRTQAEDVFALPENLRVISAMNQMPAPECRLVLTRLVAGDRVLAQHLGPQHHDVLSYWFPVYDPDARDVSPGRLLLWLTIQHAHEYGIRLIDRGEGDAAYKRELATGTTRYGRALWSGGTSRSLLARAWQSAEWRLRGTRRMKAG